METAACQAAVEVRLGKTAEAPSRLTELATEINASHERVVGKARETLEHAKRTGELLIGVKAKLGMANGCARRSATWRSPRTGRRS